ncbi:hypothetical protein AAC387_Pa09g0932 [Persea americana]
MPITIFSLSLSHARFSLPISSSLSLSQQQLYCVSLPPHRSSLPRARLPPHQQRIIISLSHLCDRTPSKSPRPKLHHLEQPRLHKSDFSCVWLWLCFYEEGSCPALT